MEQKKKQPTVLETAQAFLDDYADPDIEKRLFYEVWADRYRLSDGKRHKVWQAVRRLTYQNAAAKRTAVQRRRMAMCVPSGGAAAVPRGPLGCHE